jgi:hypothetical protein
VQAVRQRIAELTREVQAAMPVMGPIKLMDTGGRARIIKILTSSDMKKMLGRFDQLLVHYLFPTQDDVVARQLISQRLHFLQPYKPNSISTRVFEPQDHFSISADYAEAASKDMAVRF